MISYIYNKVLGWKKKRERESERERERERDEKRGSYSFLHSLETPPFIQVSDHVQCCIAVDFLD